MGLKQAYLILYNLGCAGGWAFVLYQLVIALLEKKSPKQTYDIVGEHLLWVQTAAVLEIVHSFLGLVRSPWVTTAIQVASRLNIVWGVLYLCRDAQASIGFLLCAGSWALVEIPRYVFYAANLLGAVPNALFSLRYSLFAVLYPTGITGEILTLVAALPCLKQRKDLSLGGDLLSLYHMQLLVLASYVPGAPYMYMHMVKTRKGAFRKRRAESEKKKG